MFKLVKIEEHSGSDPRCSGGSRKMADLPGRPRGPWLGVTFMNAHPSPREIQQGIERLIELGRVAHTRSDGTRHRGCATCVLFDSVPPAAMQAWVRAIDTTDDPE